MESVVDLRNALKEAYSTTKVGRNKYEVYTRYRAEMGKSRKLIAVEYPGEIFVIIGAEGSE